MLNIFRKHLQKEQEQAKQELQILENDVRAAWNFWQKNRKGYFRNQKQLPIYLILGPARFGKTTLLSQAGLSLKNYHEHTLQTVAPTKYCSFWFSREALYIDTAGTYTKPDNSKPRNDLIWQGFIKLLKKYFGTNALSGVLVVLDLPAVAQNKELLKNTLFCIRERIYTLASQIVNLPLHVVLTKCDRILGFIEYFSLLDREERLQPFGIAFDALTDRADPIPTFELKFNELLKKLNGLSIDRLQKTSYLEQKIRIKTLPVALDNLRQVFMEILSEIPSSAQIQLCGMYLCSSLQEGVPNNHLKNSILQKFNLQEKPTYALESNSNRSYFIEDIFKKVIIAPTVKNQSPTFTLPQINLSTIYTLIASIALIIATTFISYNAYSANLKIINSLKDFLTAQTTTDQVTGKKTLQQLAQDNNSWWLNFGINEVKNLYQAFDRAEKISVLQLLAIEIQNSLEQQINSAEIFKSPTKLYNTLTVYLMLSDSKHFTAPFIKEWLNTDGIIIEPHKKTLLLTAIATIPNLLKPIDLNQNLIAKARESILLLPPPQLMSLALENSYRMQMLNIPGLHPVPKMYTKEYFNKIYNEKIKMLVSDTNTKDWVLNAKLNANLDTAQSTKLIQDVKNLYLNNYAETWNQIIKSGPTINFNNCTTAAKQLNTLLAADSPFLQLLQQTAANTNFSGINPELKRLLSEKLQGLESINIVTIQEHLRNLAKLFADINNDLDPDKAAFTLAKNHQNSHDALTTLKEFANTQPPLMQSWLQKIITNSWQAILVATSNHINKLWTTTVYATYQNKLQNKYPLFKDSKNDISIADFNSVFGPQGLLDNFLAQYIKPFANTDKVNWSWKNIEGQKLNSATTALEVFLRATLIQRMFYPHKTDTAQAHFVLTPIEMTPQTQSFTLHLDGQKINLTPGLKASERLVWPGPKPGAVSIDFVDHQGKYYSSSQFGPWAWFKVLDKASLTASNDNTKDFEITFDLNGNAAKYRLTNADAVNPFILEVVNNFRCPEKLF